MSLGGTCYALTPVHLTEPVWEGPILSHENLPQSVSRNSQLTFKYTKIRTLFELPQDPFVSQQWYFYNWGQNDYKGNPGIKEADIKLFPALQIFTPRQPVVIAIIDSGLDCNHEDIDPNILWVNPGETGTDQLGRDRSNNGIDDDQNGYVDDLHGWNMFKDIHEIQDSHYHGTHISGLLAAVTDNNIGISGGFNSVKLMLLKIFDLEGTASRHQIAKAIIYACDNGARIINASWGSSYHSGQIENAIEYCNEKGILFVNAAGNSRKNLDIEPDYPSAYGIQNQIVVAATDNQDLPTNFSNYGETVDVAAPGNYILSLFPDNKYRSFSGTSQSAPMVAGALALLWSQEPWLSHLEVKQRLIRSADQRLVLRRWLGSAARLNVYNLLANLDGQRIPTSDSEPIDWHEQEYLLESRHPYSYNTDEIYQIRVPQASAIKVYFDRFDFSNHGDTLSIITDDGKVIEHLNSTLPAFWSEAIPGDIVLLRLKTNDKVNSWGFRITKIKFSKTENQLR